MTLFQIFKTPEKAQEVISKYRDYKNQFVIEYHKRFNDVMAHTELIEIVRQNQLVEPELIEAMPELRGLAKVKEEVKEEVKVELPVQESKKRGRKPKEICPTSIE